MFDTDGPVAEEIAGLWWLMLVLGTAVFVGSETGPAPRRTNVARAIWAPAVAIVKMSR